MAEEEVIQHLLSLIIVLLIRRCAVEGVEEILTMTMRMEAQTEVGITVLLIQGPVGFLYLPSPQSEHCHPPLLRTPHPQV
jgi:hypothetical protein